MKYFNVLIIVGASNTANGKIGGVAQGMCCSHNKDGMMMDSV